MTTKKHTHRSPLNRPNYKGRKFTQPSETIPDQALTLREILVRHSRGETLAGKVPIYEDEESGISNGVRIETLDLVDIQERKAINAQKIAESEKIISDKKAAKAKAAKDKELADHVAKIKAQESNQSPEGH